MNNNINNSLFSLNITSAVELRSLFMNNIKNGGILIKSNKDIPMGDEVLVMISLPDNLPKTPIKGKVIWISTGKKDTPRFFGVQFVNDKTGLLNRIHVLLSSIPEDTEYEVLSF